MRNVRRICILLLMLSSFSCYGDTVEEDRSRDWFFDVQLVSANISNNNNLLAGFSIARRFSQNYFFGVSALANISEKHDIHLNGNIYPISQMSLMTGYESHLYKNIHYRLDFRIGGGIGEFTEAESDEISICECSYFATQGTGELNYAISLASRVAIQVKYMGFDSGAIEENNTGLAMVYRYTW